jgi:hypothetical protein
VRRAFAIAGILLLLAVCGAGAWLAAYPPMAKFAIADAQDLQITAVHRGEWLISYRVSTTQPTWYEALGRELEQQGWQEIDLGRYDNLKANYMRVTPLPVGKLREWAYMAITHSGDQHLARVRVRRWIELPWQLRY